MTERILLVDDDFAILDLVSDVLREQGMKVTTASSGEEAVNLAKGQTFDLIILDIMMRGMSGLEVCRTIRGAVECPILFLSARDSVKDVIEGLGLGADDYLTKPFVLEELVARIQAHLRRNSRTAPAGPVQSRPIQIGEIRLDTAAMSVTRAGEPVPLSTRELELLAYLMRNAGQTLTKERIFQDVWGTSYGDIGTVAINIKNLRSKLDPRWEYIKTVWGSGYRFVTQSGFQEARGEDVHSAEG